MVAILNWDGVDVDAVSEPNGETPLHVSSDKGYDECVALLLLAGANPSQKNFNQTSPQQLAKGINFSP